MNKEFELGLNKWGPYNKEYLGVCHIADEERGITFNVELFPGFFRRRVLVSPSSSDDGAKMWGANASLSHFAYRYELEWKDKVYCDVDFAISDDKRCDITCTFVNNTDLCQTVNMNLCASLQYPTLKIGRLPARHCIPAETITPNGAAFVDAVDYDSISCSQSLASDGLYLGEAYMDGATGKSTVLSGKYFYSSTHAVRYTAPIAGRMLIRYSAIEDTELLIKSTGGEESLALPASEGFAIAFSSASFSSGETVTLSPTGKGITLDCLVFGEICDLEFKEGVASNEPHREVCENRMTLAFDDIKTEYTVEWHEPIQMLRRFYYTDIGRALSASIHDHVSTELRGDSPLNVYENLLSEPLFLDAGESRAIHFTVSSSPCERKNAEPLYEVSCNPDGERYSFSQNMMAYNTFLNVVYPIYTRRGYIRHNTPGRNWDSLYSWDSGFIGMGLGSSDFDRAYDCLNTYLTPVGDPHSPYIFHGSVVPTQIFLYQYLFNKYPEKRERLSELYPMIRQYFDFYADMDKRAGQMKSGLLKTFDIFYNSGGWDDYPPQKRLHEMRREGLLPSTVNTTPVITTAATVLIAKILLGISDALGIGDGDRYRRVIEKYSEPILKYAWNNDIGYFSYVVHGEDGKPVGRFIYGDGTDYNMGFDGIYPYIAGITDGDMNKKIIDNVERGLMTPYGVGVVDTRAPYYYSGGYWNGSVWMPHQWILWRSLFDHGEGELAFKIAKCALELWKRETDESYCCFEHFMTANGRGCGFHQFSGLSTPILGFFESYYTPGRVTVGFETTVIDASFNEDKTFLTLLLECTAESSLVLISMRSSEEYSFELFGKTVTPARVTDGAYYLDIPKGRVSIAVYPSKK